MAQAPRAVYVSTTAADGSVDAVAVAGADGHAASGTHADTDDGTYADTNKRVAFWDLVGQLPAEVGALVKAEVALYRAEAIKKAVGYGVAVAFLVGALLVAGSAITALFVGLILTLATLIGPGLATLAVVVAALAIAGLLAWLGIKRFGGSDATETKS